MNRTFYYPTVLIHLGNNTRTINPDLSLIELQKNDLDEGRKIFDAIVRNLRTDKNHKVETRIDFSIQANNKCIANLGEITLVNNQSGQEMGFNICLQKYNNNKYLVSVASQTDESYFSKETNAIGWQENNSFFKTIIDQIFESMAQSTMLSQSSNMAWHIDDNDEVNGVALAKLAETTPYFREKLDSKNTENLEAAAAMTEGEIELREAVVTVKRANGEIVKSSIDDDKHSHNLFLVQQALKRND